LIWIKLKSHLKTQTQKIQDFHVTHSRTGDALPVSRVLLDSAKSGIVRKNVLSCAGGSSVLRTS
jgi:hypothetical protein